MKWAVLANENNIVTLGSDGKIPLDGRFGFEKIHQQVIQYRERFKPNFPRKYNEWKKFGIVTSLRNDPTKYYPI